MKSKFKGKVCEEKNEYSNLMVAGSVRKTWFSNLMVAGSVRNPQEVLKW